MANSSAKYIGAIDQGTTSSRFILFDRGCNVVAMHQIPLPNIYPQPGWQEQDPMAILSTVEDCIKKVMEKFKPSDVAAVGITNQRETLVVWDRATGKPLHNAIVWCDSRTQAICKRLERTLDPSLLLPERKRSESDADSSSSSDYSSSSSGSSSGSAPLPSSGQDALRPICGLPISTYFSAVKLMWLKENVPKVAEAIAKKQALVGTVDCWLLWNLTGGRRHATDVSNASRMMLMNLRTQAWDEDILAQLDIPRHVLPEICSNSEVYGSFAAGPLAGTKISGCIGDQQGALLGQLCVKEGNAKNTYGTGCFMLMNTGERAVPSKHGLLTTVAFQLGPQARCQFALEGSVAAAGATLTWLKDKLGLVDSPAQVDKLAESVPDSGGVYLVPAFSGLLSPHWRKDARAVIVGLTGFATKAHVCRAALEASAFQTNDVLAAMQQDSRMQIDTLRVDGGLTRSDLLCQFQADVLGIPVLRPSMAERTALGAAFAAGLAEGVGFWRSVDELLALAELAERALDAAAPARSSASACALGFRRFGPRADTRGRAERLASWNKAVQRSVGWATLQEGEGEAEAEGEGGAGGQGQGEDERRLRAKL